MTFNGDIYVNTDCCMCMCVSSIVATIHGPMHQSLIVCDMQQISWVLMMHVRNKKTMSTQLCGVSNLLYDVCDLMLAIGATMILQVCLHYCSHTVDEQNPAPADIVNISSIAVLTLTIPTKAGYSPTPASSNAISVSTTSKSHQLPQCAHLESTPQWRGSGFHGFRP